VGAVLNDGGVLVGVQKPENSHGGAEPFAQAVARFDRYPAVLHQRPQDLFLLGP